MRRLRSLPRCLAVGAAANRTHVRRLSSLIHIPHGHGAMHHFAKRISELELKQLKGLIVKLARHVRHATHDEYALNIPTWLCKVFRSHW